MSLADLFLFSRAPRAMAKYYLGSLLILFIFIFLFDDFISALLIYLGLLMFSFPFIFIIDRRATRNQRIKGEQDIASNVDSDKALSKENIDKYLDKTKCMSCMSPIEEDAEFCSNCGFKLIK